MKAFAIELKDATVEQILKEWHLKTTAEIRIILQAVVNVHLIERGIKLGVEDDSSKVSQDR